MEQRDKPEIPISRRSCRPAIEPKWSLRGGIETNSSPSFALRQRDAPAVVRAPLKHASQFTNTLLNEKVVIALRQVVVDANNGWINIAFVQVTLLNSLIVLATLLGSQV